MIDLKVFLEKSSLWCWINSFKIPNFWKQLSTGIFVCYLSFPSCFRFMTNVWAMFAVVFLAIYTANLAAVMITREEFHEFSGLDDSRVRTFRNQIYLALLFIYLFRWDLRFFFQIEPYTVNYNLLIFKFKHLKDYYSLPFIVNTITFHYYSHIWSFKIYLQR